MPSNNRWSPLRLLREARRFFRDYTSLRRDALLHFRTDHVGDGCFSDYLKALRLGLFSYDEYCKYQMWLLSRSQRNEFVSMAKMERVYRLVNNPMVRQVLNNKVQFLRTFSDFVYRKWLYVPESSLEELALLMSSHDCIVKPISGHSGFGVTKVVRQDDADWNSLYRQYREQGALVEECVSASSELQRFHPASLNTIRVVSVSKGDDVRFLGAILRMGAHNSCIDNTHAGGVFAQIDLHSGMIISEGVDISGNRYAVHPDTNIPIKGTLIHHWDQVIETCRQASQVLPEMCFAGWDICLYEGGKVELIEANIAPHFDGGMQVPLRRGVRHEVQSALSELYNLKNIV